MSAKSIEIVTHVWNPPGIEQYSQFLKWQWASLIHYPPPVTTTLSVCFNREDAATVRQLERMCEGLTRYGTGTVLLNAVDMKKSQLFRRAIGRNWCAKRSKADVVWFTDCDYLFGPGCLEYVAEHVGPDSGLCMPGYMRLCRTHAIGDDLVGRNRGTELPLLNLEHATEYDGWQSNDTWAQRKQKIAIGGVQIVGGDLARSIGYLDGTSWVDPVSEDEGFRSCRCDKVYRRLNKLKAERLPLVVYRLRHSTDGRDFTLSGENKGREVW